MMDSDAHSEDFASPPIPHSSSIFQSLMTSLGTILDTEVLLKRLGTYLTQNLKCNRAILLLLNRETATLELKIAYPVTTISPPAEATSVAPSMPYYYHPVMNNWLAGEQCELNPQNTVDHPTLRWIITTSTSEHILSTPILEHGALNGVLILEGRITSPDLAQQATQAAQAINLMLHNSRVYTKTVQQTEHHMRELNILRQIDRELNDTIELQHVFSMTLDWVLRFTNAQAASLGLYNQENDELRTIAHYGYETEILNASANISQTLYNGISHRVARSGYAEIIPDVSLDKDFVRGAYPTVSQMSVPVMREDRVIAVINVESKKLNGFTDEHLDFVEKLATRAGVAIDNARLFDTTLRERQKLSHILNNTADVVLVFGIDERIVLINPSGYAALRLRPNEDYSGLSIYPVLGDTAIIKAYQQAQTSNEPIMTEVELPNGRIYYMNLSRHENVGWVTVLHDITMFKEMDQLKSELIATVSHDLKQPLAVMNGYLELLLMHGQMDNTGMNFIDMVRKSVQNMRQLIDDLLDLAKIESGIELKLENVRLPDMIQECVTALKPAAHSKNMTLTVEMQDELPLLPADKARLQQVLMNLIGNAIKYTPPDGTIRIYGETRDRTIRLTIQDNGMGISPEDQAHIFERFYRVRRPETDSIEGTGLGLAIVKSLIEAHNGKIGLESRLGEGTSFHVVLPLDDI